PMSLLNFSWTTCLQFPATRFEWCSPNNSLSIMLIDLPCFRIPLRRRGTKAADVWRRSLSQHSQRDSVPLPSLPDKAGGIRGAGTTGALVDTHSLATLQTICKRDAVESG